MPVRSFKLMIFCLSLVACVKKSKNDDNLPADPISNPGATNDKAEPLEKFKTFLGFNYGDGYDQMKQKLGEPVEIQDDPKNKYISYYYGNKDKRPVIISVLRSTKKIYSFYVSDSRELIKKHDPTR